MGKTNFTRFLFVCLMSLGLSFQLSAQCPPVDFGVVIQPSQDICTDDFGPNMITNPSFEDGLAGPAVPGAMFAVPVPGWTIFGNPAAAGGFGNVFVEQPPNPFSPCNPGGANPGGIEPAPNSGAQLLKIFADGFVQGAFQDFPASEGETYAATIRALSPSAADCPIDNLQGNHLSELHIEYQDANGCLIDVPGGVRTSRQFTSADANTTYQELSAIGTAPAGTVTARFVILHFDFGGGGGAAYFDDATMQLVNPGSGAIACNDNIQVSLDDDCSVELTCDMALEDPEGVYMVTLLTGAGVPTGSNVLDASHIGQTVDFKVTSLGDGNTCWGSVTAEDKTGPVFDCPADTIFIPCYSDPDLIAAPIANDNCSNNVTVSLVDEIVDDSDECTAGVNNGQANSGTILIIRTFTAFDEYGNEAAEPCVQIILLTRPTNVDFPADIAWYCADYANNNALTDPTALTCGGLVANPDLGDALDATDLGVAIPGPDAFCLNTSGSGIPDVISNGDQMVTVTSQLLIATIH